jgi:secondary thiamine-phosphate synthase enzyme
MIQQVEFSLKAKSRGFHLITTEVLSNLPSFPQTGFLHLFIKHTSAGITINENADPDVLHDFELLFNRMVPENQAGLKHTMEGSDDMPSHVKSSMVGFSVQIPISGGRLNLGIWQGIYLCEFRNHGGQRKLVATVYS